MDSNSKNEFEIAPGVTNTQWKNLKLTEDSPDELWEEALEMFDKRMSRFLVPIRALMDHCDVNVSLYSGFVIVALDSLLMETIQSFRDGRENPEGRNETTTWQTLKEFLTKRKSFEKYFDSDEKVRMFYNHFRNGILHQGEVKSSGRIRIDTQEMVTPSHDGQSLVVNRVLLHEAVESEISKYKQELLEGDEEDLRKNFIKKMDEICRVETKEES
jgi:hypothetical protein